MEKIKYITPEIEIVEFQTEDIITTFYLEDDEPVRLPVIPL